MSDSSQPLDRSTPGFPVYYLCPQLIQTQSIEPVVPSNRLVLWRLLLLPRSVLPSIRVFSSESALHISWSEYWSFSFSIRPSVNIQGWFPLGLTGWIALQSAVLSRVSSSTAVQRRPLLLGIQLYARDAPSACDVSVLPVPLIEEIVLSPLSSPGSFIRSCIFQGLFLGS